MPAFLVEWLAEPSPYLLVLVPAFAFLEAAVVIGIFVSGIFLLSTSTLLYTTGTAPMASIVALAFAGAIAGDLTGYLVGRYLGDRLPIPDRYKERQEKARQLLVRSAPLAILAGRMTPAIRSLMPIAVGMSQLTPQRFLQYELLACAVWSTGLYLLVSGIDSLNFLQPLTASGS